MLTRRQYLQTMGIEVWTLRGADYQFRPQFVPAAREQMPPARAGAVSVPAGQPGAGPARAHSPDALQAVPGPEKARRTPDTAPQSPSPDGHVPPVFSLAFLHYGTVGFCLSLPDARAALPRRFCDDLARALSAKPDNVSVRILNWPMLNSADIDQSTSAAIQVVTHKFSELPGTLLVFGDDIQEYYPALGQQAPGTGQEVAGQTVFLFGSPATIMSSAATKRAVWQTLSAHRSRQAAS